MRICGSSEIKYLAQIWQEGNLGIWERKVLGQCLEQKNERHQKQGLQDKHMTSESNKKMLVAGLMGDWQLLQGTK